jgi:hypothetical protein
VHSAAPAFGERTKSYLEVTKSTPAELHVLSAAILLFLFQAQRGELSGAKWVHAWFLCTHQKQHTRVVCRQVATTLKTERPCASAAPAENP